jgi:hypothetical protein
MNGFGDEQVKRITSLFSPNRTLKGFDILPQLSSKISVSSSDFVIEMFDGSSFILTRSGVLKETSPAQR